MNRLNKCENLAIRSCKIQKRVTLLFKIFLMKRNSVYLFFVVFFIFSCQDEAEKRKAEQLKDLKKKEIVFSVINSSWRFSEPALNPQTQAIVANWSEWRLFLTELKQIPKSSIGAFQKKSKSLSQKVTDLNNNIPLKFAQPEIKSRIAALASKVKSLDLFINLDEIPDQKIVPLFAEINIELAGLARQMEELVQRDQIPMEDGESDMIRMLDTSRAIPTSQPKNNSRIN